jgi:hypothetical protein
MSMVDFDTLVSECDVGGGIPDVSGDVDRSSELSRKQSDPGGVFGLLFRERGPSKSFLSRIQA